MNSSLLARLTAPACFAFAFIAMATPDAFAQGSELSTNAARDQYQKATDAATRKDWAESRRLFLDLWKHSPTYDVASGLGQAEFKLGHHAVGAHYMALAVASIPIKENLSSRYNIEDTLKDMKAKVGTVHVTVKDGAEIRTDGELQGAAPLAVDVFLEPGPHLIEADLGKTHTSKTLQVVAGETYTVELTLPTAPPDTAVSPIESHATSSIEPPPTTRSTDDAPSYSKGRTFVLIGGSALTAVLLGVGVVEKVRAGNKQDDADGFASDVRAQQGHSCTSRSDSPACGQLTDSIESRNSANKVATAAFVGAGIAAVGTAAIVLLWPKQAQRSAGGQPQLSFSLAPHWNAVSLSGSF